MRLHLPATILLLALASAAHAGDRSPAPKPAPKPDPKQVQAYQARLATLADKQAKLRPWLAQAEQAPDSKISLPAKNPKAKPTQVQALPLALHAARQLHQSLGTPPRGTTLADFPSAVEIETNLARAQWMSGQRETALKTLAAATKPDGVNAASVWLLTFQLRQALAGSAKPERKSAGQAAADPLPDWLGLPMDWEKGAPVLLEKSPVPALEKSLEEAVRLADGTAQVRAALARGDALGCLGRWDDAAAAYAFVTQKTGEINADAGTYVIGEDPCAKRGIPVAWASEARSKRAHIDRIREFLRLSAEFIFYREGHGAMLRGDCRSAAASFDKLIALSDKKRKADKAGESPFSAAARVYRERCRIALGGSPRAMANLDAFCATDPQGLYRGEALAAMAQAAMDAQQFAAAAPLYERLLAWIRQAREAQTKEQWDFARLLPGISEVAGPLTVAGKQAWSAPDFWGRRHRKTIQPGQLVNEKTAPWYLDELEARAAKGAGFCAFIKRDFKQATLCWKRLAELGPANGEDGVGERVSDCARLLWAAKHERMLAYPEEGRLFDACPGIKDRVFYAEFLYGTREFGAAAGMLCQLLAADAKAGAGRQGAGLTDPQRDYLRVTLGTILHRAGDHAGAKACFLQALSHAGGSFTQHRAAAAYILLAHGGTAQERKTVERLEQAMIRAGGRDRFSCLIRINQATRLAHAGQGEEARKLLAWFREGDGEFYARAKWQLEHGGKLE